MAFGGKGVAGAPSSAALAALIALALALGGCPSTTQQTVPPEVLEQRALAEIREDIVPYELFGRTGAGLANLQRWLETASPEGRPEGLRLRADTMLDMWVLGQLAAGVDARSEERVVALLATDFDLPATTLEDLRAPLRERVRADLDGARASVAERDLAAEIVAFDTHAPGAVADFARWRETRLGGPRLRLLLASALYREIGGWLAGGDAAPPAPYRELSWLCTGEAIETPEELAGYCGYWCGDVSDGAAGAPTPPPGVIPTPRDIGYRLVELCGTDYFGLPRGEGVTESVVLLEPTSFVDLVLLGFVGELLAAIEADLAAGEPVTTVAADLVTAYTEAFLGGALRQDLTPAAYAFDPRLSLPRFPDAPAAGEAPVGVRQVIILSNGVYLATAPLLSLERASAGGYEVSYLEGAYHYPGFAVVPFTNLGRMPADQLADGEVVALRAGLVALERELAAHGWRAQPTSDECAGEGAELSLLVDGSTRLSALLPVLTTARRCGYAPTLHALEPEQNELTAVPVTLVDAPPEGSHVLTLSATSYQVVSGGDTTYERDESARAPLLALYRYLRDGLDAGTLADVPITVRVEGTVLDYGILANLVFALSYRRAIGDAESDAALFETPIERDADGAPRRLLDVLLVP